MKTIPVCSPTLIGNEKKYVNECLDTNWIGSQGRFIKEFETKFAEFTKTKHAVSCSNGTTALHLALLALDIKEGDEVIVPTFSFIASSNAIVYVGAKPIFIDSEPITYNMDISKIEERITEKTKAIMVVHIFGQPMDMDRIIEIAKKHNLYIIEDCAEAHGADYKGKPVGCIGDIGCFSFYGNKIITTGEGGMCVTNNETLYKRMDFLKNQAFSEIRFIHNAVGYNYRMTNIQAAIGLAQLEKAEILIRGRIENALFYNKELKDVEGITTPSEYEHGRQVYWMYGITIDEKKFGLNRSIIQKELEKYGIETRSFFFPLNLQPAYINYGIDYIKCPIAEELWNTGFYLPSSSQLAVEDIHYICNTIKNIKTNAKKIKKKYEELE